MSKKEFSTCLLTIFLKHSLTYACLSDILELFSLALPFPNSVPHSKHLLFNQFVKYEDSTIVHRCCNFYSQLLLGDSKCCHTECVAANAGEATFIQVLLDKQLQNLFQGKWTSRDTCMYNASEVEISF